jgi:hypothetical protein
MARLSRTEPRPDRRRYAARMNFVPHRGPAAAEKKNNRHSILSWKNRGSPSGSLQPFFITGSKEGRKK